jgi:hypothetical protein
MARRESTLGTGVAVYNGAVYLANIGPSGSFIPVKSTMGLSLDGTTGTAKTIADLKTGLGATIIKNCDVASRMSQTDPVAGVDIFET